MKKEGIELKDIELTSEVEIVSDNNYAVILPYAYPIIDEKVIITPGFVDYLRYQTKKLG